MDEEELSGRIINLYGEDLEHRFVRDYIESVKEDTGVVPIQAVKGEIVTTIEFLEELLTIAEQAKR